MRRKFSAAVFVLAAAAATVAHADVYRFVDAQGRVQYSDRWVPGSELIKTSHTTHEAQQAAAQARAAEQNKLAVSNDRIAAEQAQEQAQQAVRRDLAATRSEQCKAAKEKYEKSIQARRLYKVGKDGERQYLTDAEADQARLAARKDMTAVCGDIAK